MRILYSHRVQSRDGQSVHIEELVGALREQGHEVRVVGPGFYERASFGGESRTVAAIRRLLPPSFAELAELAYTVPATVALARAARQFRPDLVYERYNLHFLAGAVVARQLGVPLYLEVNSPLARERAEFGSLRLRRLARWSERLAWRSARRVIAVTAVLKDEIAAAGVDPAVIQVVPNGVDPARFPPVPAPAEAGDGPVTLGFIGFVRAWHGLDGVIEAMAAEGAPARLRLAIAGEGPACEDLRRLAEARGVADRVRFLGMVERADVPRVIAGFDICLQPSAVAYASPLKLFEYMAAGRAIVAPRQPNLAEILEHERTALLFDPGAPGAMWQAVARLADDAALRRRLGEAARAEIGARGLTWADNARRVARWLEIDRRARLSPAGEVAAPAHHASAER